MKRIILICIFMMLTSFIQDGFCEKKLKVLVCPETNIACLQAKSCPKCREPLVETDLIFVCSVCKQPLAHPNAACPTPNCSSDSTISGIYIYRCDRCGKESFNKDNCPYCGKKRTEREKYLIELPYECERCVILSPDPIECPVCGRNMTLHK